jgi:hypothetical protein
VNSTEIIRRDFPRNIILGIIDSAKKFEKNKSIDSLRQIVEKFDKKQYHTKPGKLAVCISDTGEKAYQRAVFLSEKTQLQSLGEIVWNDLELPVVFNSSSRRKCIDLIGTIDNDASVLCELKFASQKSNSNSPLYAVIELLTYYYLIQENYEELDSGHVFHKNKIVKDFRWKDFNHNSIFIVGANEKYWNYWQKRYESKEDQMREWLNSIPLAIRFFSFVDLDFKEQKGILKKYKPSLAGKTAWTEVYL